MIDNPVYVTGLALFFGGLLLCFYDKHRHSHARAERLVLRATSFLSGGSVPAFALCALDFYQIFIGVTAFFPPSVGARGEFIEDFRMRCFIDGRTALDQSYRPKGLSHDGPSMAVARLPLKRGPHQVLVELADTADPDKWTPRWSDTVEFRENQARVVLFDTKAGFSLH